MRLMKAISLSVLAGALLCSTALMAQSSTATPRIAANVDELSLTTLKGNVPSLARAEFDQGEAASSTQLTHMRLVLSRSTEQQAALDSYLAQLQDKSSPNYHKWLTPEQFGQLYGPADSDIAALVAWLESHGLQVETVSKGRTNIAFNGTVSQAEQAFHTSIHSFLMNGGQAGEQQFTSNTTDPQIPSALAPVVKGVAHLNTIRPRPHSHRGIAGQFNPGTGRLEPANALSADGARPNLTTTSGGDALWIVPADAATIYDTPNSYNANFSSGTSYTGAGVNIGVGGDATINSSTVVDYRSRFLGNTTAPTFQYCTSSSSCSSTPSCTGGTSGCGYYSSTSGDGGEAYLDTELSGGLAPGAAIYYYASTDLVTGIEAAIDANLVNIFSLSFGNCEQDMSTSDNAQINGWWEQAAGQGIAVTVSSGDSGSAGCDVTTTGKNNTPDAVGGLAVSGFASTPYNIAVGGTDFYALSQSFTNYASTTNGAYYRSALNYIPESTWNDSTTQNGAISANIPFTSSNANIWAGSGGVSSCATGSGATCAGYPKPTWQTGTGVPPDGKRDLPDVSLMSGDGTDSAAWLVCDDITAGTGTANCVTQSGGSFYFGAYGGTSTAAPSFAGILALVQQKTGSRLGQAAQELYVLYNGSHARAIFHDVTAGNISVPCTSAPDGSCVKNAAGYYFESGYNTTTGYDLATGLGSVDATQLVNYWNSSTGSLLTPTVTITSPTPNPATTAQSVSVPVSVTGSSGTPTGTVTLTGGSYNSGAQTLVGGSYSFSIPAGDLAIGADTLTVTYSGDSTYAAATNSSGTVTVNGLTASVTASAASSINSNQPLTVTGTVTGSDGTPTGTVTLTGKQTGTVGSYTSPATAINSSTGGYSITIPANTFSATGIVMLTVTYSGNSTYNAGATGTASVQMTYVSTPLVLVTTPSSQAYTGESLNVTATMDGSGVTPTGTVTLTSGSYSSGAQTLLNGSYTFTIPALTLSVGMDPLTVTYSPDSISSLIYSSATGTNYVTESTGSYSLAATPPASIAPGGSATSTITVSSSTFYSGTVTLTCALTNYPSGAVYLPSCSSGSNTVTLSSGTISGTATITVSTTAATASLAYPKLPGRGQGNGRGLSGAGGGAVLAFLLFLGIPARRRSWRSMLSILIVMAALGSLAACGGGGSTNSGSTGTPGTSSGTYTFTVTGTGNPTVTPAPTTTFTVTVT
jgi:subtilase family serine protease